MSPSSEEPATVAGAADTGSVVSDEVRLGASASDTGSAVSGEIRPEAGGADAGSLASDEVCALASGPEADSVVFGVVRAVAGRTAGADRGCVSALFSVSSAPGDDVFRASADVLCPPLRNRRHVSELCSASAALLVTAGFVPNALLVSASSWPVIGSPLRIW
jgi:hypothetical protein